MKLLKFYAPWCNPCKQQTLILSKLEGIEIQSVNVDEDGNEELQEKYNVRGLPAVFIVDNAGEVLERFNGLTQLDVIKEAIAKHEEQGSN